MAIAVTNERSSCCRSSPVVALCITFLSEGSMTSPFGVQRCLESLLLFPQLDSLVARALPQKHSRRCRYNPSDAFLFFSWLLGLRLSIVRTRIMQLCTVNHKINTKSLLQVSKTARVHMRFSVCGQMRKLGMNRKTGSALRIKVIQENSLRNSGSCTLRDAL